VTQYQFLLNKRPNVQVSDTTEV